MYLKRPVKFACGVRGGGVGATRGSALCCRSGGKECARWERLPRPWESWERSRRDGTRGRTEHFVGFGADVILCAHYF